MTEKDKSKNINVKVGGDASGNIIIGDENKVTIDQSQTTVAITDKELQELSLLFEELKEKILKEVGDDKKVQAMERAEELKEAISEEKPDLSTMEYVKNWFAKNIPTIAGSVTSIVVNPIVGKLVQAAGDAAVEEFNRRFK